MTTTAWLMLAVTWAVILFFTGRFFWKVMQLPSRGERVTASPPRPVGAGVPAHRRPGRERQADARRIRSRAGAPRRQA